MAISLASIFLISCKQEVIKIGIAQWASNPEYAKNIEGFKESLREEIKNKNSQLEFIVWNAETDKDTQRKIIQEFVDISVDLIYSLGTHGTLIAKELTQFIPIVFSIVPYPVEASIIDSLQNSKNNLVGTRNYISPAEQYYFFERLYKNTKNLAFVHRKKEPSSVIQYREFKYLLGKRNINVIDFGSVDQEDIRKQLKNKVRTFDSIYSACDTLVQSGGEEIVIEFSRKYKKPSFTCNKDGVYKGTLVGNTVDFYSIGKSSGEKAAFILMGAEPSWLQTESPREGSLMVNQRSASILGVKIPEDVISIAKVVNDHSR